MNLKKVYFVCHGESEDDFNDLHPTLVSPLSEDGQHQVALLAGRLSHMNFGVIVASPLERAQETAEIIAKETKKTVEFDELFSEIKQPTLLEGKSLDDPEYDSLRHVLHEKWSYPAWHYADEENFQDVKRRAIEALSSLKQRKEEIVVVISHPHFLTMLFLVMVLGKQVTADEYLQFNTFSYMDNAAMSLCELTEKGIWKMRTWNDMAHITELIH